MQGPYDQAPDRRAKGRRLFCGCLEDANAEARRRERWAVAPGVLGGLPEGPHLVRGVTTKWIEKPATEVRPCGRLALACAGEERL